MLDMSDLAINFDYGDKRFTSFITGTFIDDKSKIITYERVELVDRYNADKVTGYMGKNDINSFSFKLMFNILKNIEQSTISNRVVQTIVFENVVVKVSRNELHKVHEVDIMMDWFKPEKLEELNHSIKEMIEVGHDLFSENVVIKTQFTPIKEIV